MLLLAIKLGVSFVVFSGVFTFAHKKMANVEIAPWYAIPIAALVFSLLNVLLYVVATKVLNFAAMSFFTALVPLAVNGALLHLTAKLIRPLKIDGMMALMKLVVILTLSTGAIEVGMNMAV